MKYFDFFAVYSRLALKRMPHVYELCVKTVFRGGKELQIDIKKFIIKRYRIFTEQYYFNF